MKKNISINLQGIIFHIEDDGYEVLSRYLQEVKAHFASYQGHEEIVADIEGRIAELFAARLAATKQVITLADVEEMTAKMGRVSDFQTTPDDDDEPAYAGAGATTGSQSAGYGPGASYAGAATAAAAATAADTEPRRLYRDLAHRKIAGVCAGLAHYFRVNPLVVRLVFVLLVVLPNTIDGFDHVPGTRFFRHEFDFGGLAILAYIILWIVLPKRTDAPAPIDTLDLGGVLNGRKLFRDTDGGKVAGVAAGLAAYFRTDVVLIRVLFLLGLFLGGSSFLIYVVLWVVVPEARSMSEKMQMRGDAVTLSGIDNNLRTTPYDPDAPAPANRPVGTFVESTFRNAQPALGFIGTLIRWAVAGLLIFMGGSWLFGVVIALGAALSIIPFTAIEQTHNGFMFDDSFGALARNLTPWGAVAGGLLLGIPSLAMILLGLRLILRRPVLSRTASSVLLGLWLLGIVGSVVAAFEVAANYRTRAAYVTTETLAPVAGRSIVLDSRNLEEHFENVRFSFVAADSNAAPQVEKEFLARGRTTDAARLTAQQSMLYTITQRDSVLVFDQGFLLRDNAPFRAQKLNLTLHLPLGKTYRLTPLFQEHLDDDDFVGGDAPDDNQEHRAILTPQGKFRCLDCPSGSASDGDDNDDDHDEVVNLGLNGTKMQVRVNTDGDDPKVRITTETADFSLDPAHYGSTRRRLDEPGEFSEVEAHGNVRVLVRQGDRYSVEAAGHADDVRDLTMSTDGDRLTLRNHHNDNLFSLNHDPLLVTITMPRLRHLDLSGACQANVSGFRDEDLRVEASGASTARFDVAVPHLEVELNGASRADFQGRADELSIDCSGTSQVSALALKAQRATVELSGISEAEVFASESLKVDLSGSSHVTYGGNPSNIEKDLNGTSSLEQAG